MSETAITIGPATGLDRPWLSGVDRHVTEPWMLRCIEQDAYLIARSGDGPVGFLRHSLFWGAIPYMELIFVDAAHRRQGFGTRMFEAWQTAMRQQGARLLMTSSMSDEPEPQAWHRRNGFEPSGALTFGELQATPEVFFVKALQPRQG